MSRSLSVALLGATGLVGEHVLTALSRGGSPIGRVQVFGSANRSPRVDSVAFGGESLGVEPITHLAELDADVALLCVPPGVSGRLASQIVGKVGLLVDVGTSSGLDSPLLHPAMSAGVPLDGSGAVRLPGATAAVLAPLLGPLVGAGLADVSATVLLSASNRGRAAVDELGQQVVARLNQQDPPRRVFPTGLAFDVVPEDTPGEEWSATEEAAAAEIAALAGLGAGSTTVQVTTAPLFAGVAASLHLRGVSLAAVEPLWRSAELAQEVVRVERLRPRAFTGKPQIGWGRLRALPGGGGVAAWVVADPIAVAATLAAEVVRRVAEGGLLSARDDL